MWLRSNYVSLFCFDLCLFLMMITPVISNATAAMAARIVMLDRPVGTVSDVEEETDVETDVEAVLVAS